MALKHLLTVTLHELILKKELPFEKLVGIYELDKNSKSRYNIKDSINLKIEIKKDTTFFTEKYISPFNRKIEFKELKSKLFYINNYKENNPIIDLSLANQEFTNGGVIDVYYRKKDSAIALLVLTPMVPATKENNMKYIEADYLRYIKVKDSIKK